MGVRDLWHRTLVYFGLAEGESYYDDDEEVTAATADIDRTYKERGSVRRIEKPRRSRSREVDEIYSAAPAPPPRPGRTGPAPAGYGDDPGAATAVLRRDTSREEVTTAVKVHLIAPRSFNDAQ